MIIDRIDALAMGAAIVVSDGVEQSLCHWMCEVSENDLHRDVLEPAGPLFEVPLRVETTACFAKSTLVHTKNGLVPIEKIKIGDWVLSKPEDGTGELAYKRVTQTFAHGPTEVVNLLFRFGGKDDFIFAEHVQHRRLTTTLNHPIWAIGNGWTDVGDLSQWPGKESRLVLANERQAIVTQRESIFQTSRPNIGWTSSIGNVTDVLGGEWDFENQCVHQANVHAEEMIQELNYPAILKIPVYNIEVEDFHTYFVGEEGVWVHNKTVSTAIRVQNGGPALPEGTPVFFSKAEVAKFIRDHQLEQARSSLPLQSFQS